MLVSYFQFLFDAYGESTQKTPTGVSTCDPAANARVAAAHVSSDCAGVFAGKPSCVRGLASVAGQSRAGRQVAEGRLLGVFLGRALWASLAVSGR
ncbi:MAG: hypothetical protein JWQ50_3528 [Caballeronia mineralivorans]|nr:hypothetical protein [Caballeronia mineralivorans]